MSNILSGIIWEYEGNETIGVLCWNKFGKFEPLDHYNNVPPFR